MKRSNEDKIRVGLLFFFTPKYLINLAPAKKGEENLYSHSPTKTNSILIKWK